MWKIYFLQVLMILMESVMIWQIRSEEVAEIIQKLINNTEMILTISQNAIDYIKQNNSLELISNKEYKFYEKVHKF